MKKDIFKSNGILLCSLFARDCDEAVYLKTSFHFISNGSYFQDNLEFPRYGSHPFIFKAAFENL